jgi:hypothetical protein
MTHKEYKKHPSYGTVLFTRTGGHTGKLFGSSIKSHGTTIRLSVHQASYAHDLGRDWIHGDLSPIVEVEMSAVQFTELLTTMNVGSGVPCTIRHRMNDEGKISVIDDPPDDEVEAERVRHYFRETMEKLASRLVELTDQVDKSLSKKSVGKKDREAIRDITAMIVQDVEKNFPFVAESFQKVMDKVVAGAKAEVDAFISHMAMTTGLEVLRERNADAMIDTTVSDVPLLPAKGDDE